MVTSLSPTPHTCAPCRPSVRVVEPAGSRTPPIRPSFYRVFPPFKKSSAEAPSVYLVTSRGVRSSSRSMKCGWRSRRGIPFASPHVPPPTMGRTRGAAGGIKMTTHLVFVSPPFPTCPCISRPLAAPGAVAAGAGSQSSTMWAWWAAPSGGRSSASCGVRASHQTLYHHAPACGPDNPTMLVRAIPHHHHHLHLLPLPSPPTHRRSRPQQAQWGGSERRGAQTSGRQGPDGLCTVHGDCSPWQTRQCQTHVRRSR